MNFATWRFKPIFLTLCILASAEAKEKPQPPPAPPPRLTILARAAPSINRDPLGNPLSIVVRVFHLKDKTAFSRLTFEGAAGGRPESEPVGPECLGRSEFTLLPGGTHREAGDLIPGTRYVGVVGLFRHPDPHHWRCLARVAPPAPAPEEPRKVSWLKRKLTKKKPPPPPPPWNPEVAFEVEDCWVRVPGPQAEPLPGQPEPFAPRCPAEAAP